MQENIFINLSNHPSINWDKDQINASQIYGKIIDMPFPAIDPNIDENEIDKITDEYLGKIISLKPQAVMCQGEFTFSYSLIKKLLLNNIMVLAACSERVSTEENGTRVSYFKFVRFRRYE